MTSSSPPTIKYGQVVVGPPGSGKTTYCDGMQQYLKLLGRDVYVINLDPANEAATATSKNENKHKSNNNNKSQSDSNSNNGDQGIDGTATTLLPYDAIYDVCTEVVNLTSVMEQTKLGPNGGLVYCMEYMEAHIDTIISGIQQRVINNRNNNNNKHNSTNKSRPYFIFDLPGQVELYTHSTCVQTLLQRLIQAMNLQLTCVQLIDAYYCTDATKFISAALLGTTTMIRLELPTVNVLSKIDLLERYGELPFQFDYFTQCHDLDRLVPFLSDPERRFHHHNHQHHHQGNNDDNNNNNNDDDDSYDYADDPEYIKIRRKRQQSSLYEKFEKLHKAMVEVVDDFGLLCFLPLDISDAESVGRVLAKIDKCNGYVFLEATVNSDLFQCAIKSSHADDFETISDVRERIASPESIKEFNK